MLQCKTRYSALLSQMRLPTGCTRDWRESEQECMSAEFYLLPHSTHSRNPAGPGEAQCLFAHTFRLCRRISRAEPSSPIYACLNPELSKSAVFVRTILGYVEGPRLGGYHFGSMAQKKNLETLVSQVNESRDLPEPIVRALALDVYTTKL